MAELKKTVTIFMSTDELNEKNVKKPDGCPMTKYYRDLVREGWKYKDELDFNERVVIKDKGFWAHITIFLPLAEAREHDEARTKGKGYRGKMPMTTFYLQLVRIGWRHKFETSKPSP